MIALGNNEYRTLDQKMYIGNQQVGKVYLGETLIYPEEKIIIGGITIDVNYHSLDGNMFDLGYAPTKNTRFEFCCIPDSVSTAMAFFGTQHDNKCDGRYTYLLTGDNKDTRANSAIGGNPQGSDYRNYNVKVESSNNSYTEITKDTSSNSTWSTQYVGNNGYANYNDRTKFCLMRGNHGGNTEFSFRYGGTQNTSSGENWKSIVLERKKPFVVGLDDYTDSQGTNTKWYGTKGKYGRYYYILNNETIPSDVDSLLANGNLLSSTSTYSSDKSGGNIWLNAINIRIPNPNVSRPYDKNNYTFDEDLIYYSDTTNAGFVYMIIWEVGGPKTLYTQNYDENRAGSKVLINKYVQISDGQGGYKFRDPDPNTGEVPVDEIIYPFYRCKPV